MRCPASGGGVIPGDVDDRHRNVRCFETVPHLDTRNITQVDIKNDANHPVEIAVICEGFRRGKQHAFVAQLPQQSRYALQHHGVVIDDKNNVLLGQAATSMLKVRLGSNAMRHRRRRSDDGLDPCQARRQWNSRPAGSGRCCAISSGVRDVLIAAITERTKSATIVPKRSVPRYNVPRYSVLISIGFAKSKWPVASRDVWPWTPAPSPLGSASRLAAGAMATAGFFMTARVELVREIENPESEAVRREKEEDWR